jgi:hypothetical protein
LCCRKRINAFFWFFSFSRKKRTPRGERKKKEKSEWATVHSLFCLVTVSQAHQKICSKSAKTLTLEIKPNSTVLMPEDNFICELLMEPYTRKYGVKLVYDGDYDLKVNPLILDDKVNTIFEGIFAGEGLNLIGSENEIYPLANVSLDWINSFLKMDGQDLIEGENKDDLANSFSEFLEDVAPQFRENVISASEFINEKNKN